MPGMHAHGCQTRASSSMAGCRTAGGGRRTHPARSTCRIGGGAAHVHERAVRAGDAGGRHCRIGHAKLGDGEQGRIARGLIRAGGRAGRYGRRGIPLRRKAADLAGGGRIAGRGEAHPDAGGAAADRSDWAAPPPHAELRLRHGAPRAHCDALRQAARPGRPAPRRRPDTCTAFNAGRIAGCKCRRSTSGWPQPAPRPLPQARSEGSPCGAGRSARPRT